MLASLALSAALLGTPNVHNWEVSNAFPSAQVTTLQTSVLINPPTSATISYGWIGVYADNILFQVGWQDYNNVITPFETVISSTGHIYSWNHGTQNFRAGDFLGLKITYDNATNNWGVWYAAGPVWTFMGQSPMPFTPGQEQYQAVSEVWNGAPIPLVTANSSIGLSAPVLEYVR